MKVPYIISTDTANGIVDSAALKQEIQDSTITIAIDYINASGDNLDIYMKAPLDTSDSSALDSVVSAHTGVPLIDDTVSDVQIINKPSIFTEKPIDTLDHIYTHDWARPETWYQESTKVVDETSTAIAGQKEFIVGTSLGTNVNLVNSPILCLNRGLVTGEDLLTTNYNLDVRVNGVQKTEQDWLHYKNLNINETFASVPGDYHFDRTNNKIIFKNSLNAGDDVKITYYYSDEDTANRSRFRIVSPVSKYLKVELIEIQFSSDIIVNDTIKFEMWAGNGAMKLMDKKYKTIDNFQDDAIRVNAEFAAVGGSGPRGCMSSRVMTWDYISAFPIYSSSVMWLDVSLEHDEPFGGSRATATVYAKLFDEV